MIEDGLSSSDEDSAENGEGGIIPRPSSQARLSRIQP